MKDPILVELAARWEREATVDVNACENGSKDAEVGNAIRRGNREAKRECADTLRTLIGMLGDS